MTESGCSCRNWWLVFVLEVKLTVPSRYKDIFDENKRTTRD